MALCVLTAEWKKSGDQNVTKFIDGVLAIIVDHGLREESQEEAEMVSSRVSNMGICGLKINTSSVSVRLCI